MNPYLPVFALVCAILCYGLLRKPVWMWYLGWVFFYLFAGHLCLYFFESMNKAGTHLQVLFSSIYLLGGLVFWLPTILWWIKAKPKFVAKY